MNATTTTYVHECRAPGSRLAAASRAIVLPEVYGKSFGGLLLDRPILADEREITAFGDDLRELLGILTDIPHRVFGGDLDAYCSALGIDPRRAGLLMRDHDLPADPLARADAYHDGTAYRLLELNVGSELGGMDAAQLNRGYLDVPAFADFARRHDLRHRDTSALVARTLRRTGTRVTGRAEPTVALLEGRGGLAAHEHVFLSLREAMARHGLDLLLGEITDVEQRDGRIRLHDREVDVVLRFFVADEIVDDPAALHAFDLLVAAHRAGRAALVSPLHVGARASKANLALVHEPRVRRVLGAGERDLVDRVVPWTRVLPPAGGPAGPGWPDDGAELLRRGRDEQADLVIKPGIGYGGVGTLIGPDTDEATWQEALAAPDRGGRVLQRLVRPAPEPVVDPDTGGTEGWQANWGIFVDTEGYAGGFVRALRPKHGSVISYSNPETRGTCIFTAAETLS